MGFIFYPPPQPQQAIPHAPIPAQGDTPPRYSIVTQMETRFLWEPPPPAPWQKPSTIVALTLTYGNQPPPYSIATTMELRRLWEPPDPPPTQWQQATAAWNFPPAAVNVPPPYSIVNLTTIRQAWEPAPPMPQQDRRYIVALTLAYGQQPPPYSTSLPPGAWWATPPAPQMLPGSAAWNVPAIVTVPYAPLQAQILTAWQTLPPLPQAARPIAGIIPPPIVNNPPPYSTANLFAIRQAWEPGPPMPILGTMTLVTPGAALATGPLFIEMAMTWTGGAAMSQVWTSGAEFGEVHYGD